MRAAGRENSACVTLGAWGRVSMAIFLPHESALQRTFPTSDGVSRTCAPAFLSAFTFDSPLPREPVTIAPACPMRRPGGAVRPAIYATMGFRVDMFVLAA